MEHIKQALQLWPENRIYLAFNGGKDATVLLHLYHLALGPNHAPINAVWFKKDRDEFPEVEEFVQQSVNTYNLNLIVKHGSYVDCLREFLSEVNSRKGDLVLLMIGVRSCDSESPSRSWGARDTPAEERRSPYSMYMPVNLCGVTMPGMRCHPLLSWSYGDIWNFIKTQNVAVCKLYYKGFSSLGPVSLTLPNPQLKNGTIDPQNLEDWSTERQYRQPTAATPSLPSTPPL